MGFCRGLFLGPVLFLIFINHLDEDVNSNILKFAVYTKINVKNCSLYTLLTATDRRPQKSRLRGPNSVIFILIYFLVLVFVLKIFFSFSFVLVFIIFLFSL